MPTRMRDVSLGEQEEIIRAKQELEHAFDAVDDLLVIIDPDYTIVRVNRAMAIRMSTRRHFLISLSTPRRL